MLTFARSLFINAFLIEESYEEYRANAMFVCTLAYMQQLSDYGKSGGMHMLPRY